ncbi:MAG: AbrB/MazE/SpoVT family DNA-binding domain-containing protein [Planctomycetota bacterium]
MTTKVQKWGNSLGVRIGRSVLADARITVGDEVDLAVRDGVILIRPVNRVRGKYSLRKLVARIPKGYRVGETSTGRPVGKEVW